MHTQIHLSEYKIGLKEYLIFCVMYIQVSSRVIWIVSGLVLFLASVIGKIGAALALIPDPVIAGLSFVSMSSVVAAGTNSLQSLNLNSARNELILGLSILLGLSVPTWAKQNPAAYATGKMCFFV